MVMAEQLSADERISLIRENLQEILKFDIIEDIVKRQNKPLSIYWGRSPSNSSGTVLGPLLHALLHHGKTDILKRDM